MLEIRNIQIDGKADNRTDHLEPELTFALESDVPGTSLAEASVTVCGQTFDCGNDQTGFPLKGLALQPFTEYLLEIRVRDNHGQEAAAAASFRTGRLKLPWKASWITDKDYSFGKKQSPVPMTFRKCFPIICNELLIGVGNMVINVVLGRQSEQAIAAIAVFRTLEGMVISFFAGFSNAASVLVGTCVGSGELDAAYERAKRLVFLCGGTILCVCLVLLGIHKPLLSAMSLSGESMEIGSHMLMIYCVAAVIRMCNWVQNDTYRAAGDAAFGTIREIAFMYAMVLPLVCLTGLVWKAPFLIVFACCYIDEPIRLILMQRHMYSGKWVRPVTPQGMEALPAFMEKHGRHKKAA